MIMGWKSKQRLPGEVFVYLSYIFIVKLHLTNHFYLSLIISYNFARLISFLRSNAIFFCLMSKVKLLILGSCSYACGALASLGVSLLLDYVSLLNLRELKSSKEISSATKEATVSFFRDFSLSPRVSARIDSLQSSRAKSK